MRTKGPETIGRKQGLILPIPDHLRRKRTWRLTPLPGEGNTILQQSFLTRLLGRLALSVRPARTTHAPRLSGRISQDLFDLGMQALARMASMRFASLSGLCQIISRDCD
jgi:hypothetical protein